MSNHKFETLIVSFNDKALQKIANLFPSDAKVQVSNSYEQGLSFLSEFSYDCVIIIADNIISNTKELLGTIFDNDAIKSFSPFVVIYDDAETAKFSREFGVSGCIAFDDINRASFENSINNAMENFRLKSSLRAVLNDKDRVEQRFKDLSKNLSDWVWEVGSDLKIIFSTTNKRKLANTEVGDKFYNCFLADESVMLQADLMDIMESQQSFQDKEYWGVDAYGNRICWSLSGVVVFDENSRVIGCRGTATDISKDKISTDRLYNLLNYDELTGLYNRQRFLEELEHILRQHQRRNQQGALLIFKVDHFRYLNHQFGVVTGDKLLKNISIHLKNGLRDGDTVARIGGAEFAVVLSSISDGYAEKYAKRVMSAVKNDRMNFNHGDDNADVAGWNEEHSIINSLCCGIVNFSSHVNLLVDDLLSHTEISVDKACRDGVDNLVIGDLNSNNEDYLAGLGYSMEELTLLMDCLDNEAERLILHYQGMVPLSSSKMSNNDNVANDCDMITSNDSKELSDKVHVVSNRYEVLVRLLDDDGEIMMPKRFIALAEEVGLIARIDKIVAKRAISSLAKMQSENVAIGDDDRNNIILSINMSPQTLQNNEVIFEIEEYIQEMDIKPNSLIIEFTEASSKTSLMAMREVINRFKKLGVLFALDDCGVGFSSLDYIRKLDIDFIKIDGSFVRDLYKNKDDGVFVKALHDIAEHMNIKTIAEMVENQETVDCLEQLGIDFAQGYHFSVPSDEMNN